MGQPTRIVERLRLRAGSESAVRLALPMLEDALRTATLPDAGARLLFVRRLHLGRLPPRASAQSLSLLLESRFAAAEWRIVHASDAAADDAHAVWFRDVLEACELAAHRVAAGRSVEAWFWPLAVPALTASTSRPDRLRSIAFALAALEEAPAALPAWTASLVGAGCAAPLLAALRPGDGTALRRAARIDRSEPGRSIGPPGGSARAPRIDDGARPDDPAAADRDDRIEFVERMLQRTMGDPTGWPAAAAVRWTDAKSTVRSRDTLRPEQTLDLTRQSVDAATPGQVTDAPAPPVHLTQHGPTSDVVAARTIERDPSRLDATERLLSRDRDSRSMRNTRRESPGQPWVIPGTAPTAAGGLLFLVPVLERLGFGDWCASAGHADRHSPDACARQIFHLLLVRLRIDEDDSAWQLAAPAHDRDDHPADDAFEHLTSRLDRLAPRHASRRRASARSGDTTSPRSQIDASGDRSLSIAELWLAACRRFLRRRARIGLATLVVRPARLAVTATHVDLFFRLSAADLRVRRAGFDVDPGWVPWLMKVVAFHYEDRPWS